jgi:hypothetical protein
MSELNGEEGLTVSVYNNNFSLVRDVRSIDALSGQGELKFDNIPENIIPETVNITSLTAPGEFNVYRQEYDYDLISPDKLLDDYVGKKIKIMVFNEYQDRKETVEAELLSNGSTRVYRVDDEIFIGYPGYIVLPEIPDNFTPTPQLLWTYDNKARTRQKIEVTYLTGGMSWRADYILFLEDGDLPGALSCWATINNTSGKCYRDSRVRIVAGDVNRETSVAGMKARYAMDTAVVSGVNEATSERPLFEYHVYNVPGRMTLANNRSVQARLFSSSGISVKKEYETRDRTFYYARSYSDEGKEVPVKVILGFKNDEQNNLGIPFPGGTIRVYKKDEGNGTFFIGEDRIKDIPRGEEVEISLGTAFDIKVFKKQTDYKQVSKNLYQTAWEITLRNNKDKSVNVNVYENIQGNWSVVDSSLSWEKTDSHTIKFMVPVPSGKEVKVNYRVRTGI